MVLHSSIAMDPETLTLLQGVFDKCMGELEHLYGPNSSSANWIVQDSSRWTRK